VYRTGGGSTGCVRVMQGLLNVSCVGIRFSFVTSGNMKLALTLLFVSHSSYLKMEAVRSSETLVILSPDYTALHFPGL